MVYWSASEAERMPVVMDAVLQKYFPEKTWGAIPLINERGEVELVTIDRVEYTGGGIIYNATLEKIGYNTFPIRGTMVRKSDGTPL